MLHLHLETEIIYVMISVFGWLPDKGQREFITLHINNVVYTSVLTLCFGLTENLHQLCIVLHTSTLKTSAKILGKVQLPWCITENSATTIRFQKLGRITFSSYTFSQFWQFQNPALDLLHAALHSSGVSYSVDWTRKFKSVVPWAPKQQWPRVLHQDGEWISECVLLIYSSCEHYMWN